MSQTSTTTAGIDTSKAKLDIAIDGRPDRWQFANASRDWPKLAVALRKAGVTRVGIEATGGYERGVVRHLRTAGFEVLVLQPVQVRAVARMRLRRAKNDAIDAVLIAACAALIEAPELEPDQRLSKLADQLTFVEQLEADIARWKTRLEHIDDARVRARALAYIARLEKMSSGELAQIVRALRSHVDLGRRLDLVLSVPGIGERTSVAIVVRYDEHDSWQPHVHGLASGVYDCD